MTNDDKYIELLLSGLDQLRLKQSSQTIGQLTAYITLLIKWNTLHNLTASSEPKTIIIRHLLDSLSIKNFIVGPNILDFGSGAGFPGIPLALTLPEHNFILLDSSKKKTTFLNQVTLSLKIKNISVENKRVEDFCFTSGFTTIVTRATTKIGAIIDKTKHLCAKSGQILIMKGKSYETELKYIKEKFETHEIVVPYLNEKRYLIKILMN